MIETTFFLADARENGVSYALIRAAEYAKEEARGKRMSASEKTVHERTIRALVASYGTAEITPAQLDDILTVLEQSKGIYPPSLSENVVETLPAELNALTWAKSLKLAEKQALQAAEGIPVSPDRRGQRRPAEPTQPAAPTPAANPTPEPTQAAPTIPVVEAIVEPAPAKPVEATNPAPAPTPTPVMRSRMFGGKRFAGA